MSRLTYRKNPEVVWDCKDQLSSCMTLHKKDLSITRSSLSDRWTSRVTMRISSILTTSPSIIRLSFKKSDRVDDWQLFRQSDDYINDRYVKGYCQVNRSKRYDEETISCKDISASRWPLWEFRGSPRWTSRQCARRHDRESDDGKSSFASDIRIL